MIQEQVSIAQQRDNYREIDAVNFSTLKQLASHPSNVGEEVEPSIYMQKGDLLDILLYEGEEGIHNKYYVSSIITMPSDTIKEIIEASPAYDEQTLVKTARQMNYGASNWKDQTIANKIQENGGAEYMMELENAAGKPIISFEVFSGIQKASKLLKSHRFTKNFFVEGWQNQYPIVGELHVPSVDHPVNFKGLLDGLLVQENNKDIAVYDLKFTSYNLSGWKSSYMSNKLQIQAAIYSDLAALNERSNGASSYNISFFNVVYSESEHRVITYKIHPSMISVGREGGTSYTGNFIKGYQQLAKELLWHRAHDLWEYPYEVYANNGIDEIEFVS